MEKTYDIPQMLVLMVIYHGKKRQKITFNESMWIAKTLSHQNFISWGKFACHPAFKLHHTVFVDEFQPANPIGVRRLHPRYTEEKTVTMEKQAFLVGGFNPFETY